MDTLILDRQPGSSAPGDVQKPAKAAAKRKAPAGQEEQKAATTTTTKSGRKTTCTSEVSEHSENMPCLWFVCMLSLVKSSGCGGVVLPPQPWATKFRLPFGLFVGYLLENRIRFLFTSKMRDRTM